MPSAVLCTRCSSRWPVSASKRRAITALLPHGLCETGIALVPEGQRRITGAIAVDIRFGHFGHAAIVHLRPPAGTRGHPSSTPAA